MTVTMVMATTTTDVTTQETNTAMLVMATNMTTLVKRRNTYDHTSANATGNDENDADDDGVGGVCRR